MALKIIPKKPGLNSDTSKAHKETRSGAEPSVSY